jgi:hypothetical protein
MPNMPLNMPTMMRVKGFLPAYSRSFFAGFQWHRSHPIKENTKETAARNEKICADGGLIIQMATLKQIANRTLHPLLDMLRSLTQRREDGVI